MNDIVDAGFWGLAQLPLSGRAVFGRCATYPLLSSTLPSFLGAAISVEVFSIMGHTWTCRSEDEGDTKGGRRSKVNDVVQGAAGRGQLRTGAVVEFCSSRTDL